MSPRRLKTGAYDARREVELLRGIEDARAGADDRLHRPRVAAAETALQRARTNVIDYTRAHIKELLDEIEPEARKTTADLIHAREKAAKLVAGPEAARQDVVARIKGLAACVHRGRAAPAAEYLGGMQTNVTNDPETAQAWQLPESESEVPLPAADVVEAVHATYNPQAVEAVTA